MLLGQLWFAGRRNRFSPTPLIEVWVQDMVQYAKIISEKWEKLQGHFKDMLALQWLGPIFDAVFGEYLGK